MPTPVILIQQEGHRAADLRVVGTDRTQEHHDDDPDVSCGVRPQPAPRPAPVAAVLANHGEFGQFSLCSHELDCTIWLVFPAIWFAVLKLTSSFIYQCPLERSEESHSLACLLPYN